MGSPGFAAAEGQLVGLRATGQPVEKRLEILEATARQMEAEVHKLRGEFKREQVARTKGLEKLQQEFDMRSEQTSRLVESVHTGGLSMSIAGLLWLAAGVVLTSVPDSLHPFFCE